MVGKPLATLLSQRSNFGNATVTLCHSRTKNLASFTERADILVSAVGHPNLIVRNMIKSGAHLIDVGINRIDDEDLQKGYRIVGDIDSDKKKLIDVTKECLLRGINEAKPGKRIGDIGYAIQSYAESFGFGVVKELVGHGIGEELHEEPQIPNYGVKDTGDLIKEGMCFAIEPMINFGSDKVYTKTDNWTVCTRDGCPSAHFEHTITINKDGANILTI